MEKKMQPVQQHQVQRLQRDERDIEVLEENPATVVALQYLGIEQHRPSVTENIRERFNLTQASFIENTQSGSTSLNPLFIENFRERTQPYLPEIVTTRLNISHPYVVQERLNLEHTEFRDIQLEPLHLNYHDLIQERFTLWDLIREPRLLIGRVREMVFVFRNRHEQRIIVRVITIWARFSFLSRQPLFLRQMDALRRFAMHMTPPTPPLSGGGV